MKKVHPEALLQPSTRHYLCYALAGFCAAITFFCGVSLGAYSGVNRVEYTETSSEVEICVVGKKSEPNNARWWFLLPLLLLVLGLLLQTLQVPGKVQPRSSATRVLAFFFDATAIILISASQYGLFGVTATSLDTTITDKDVYSTSTALGMASMIFFVRHTFMLAKTL